MARVPDFIKKNRVGYKAPVARRQYKYTPPIPSLAIRFEELPGGSVPKQKSEELLESVLGTQELFAITTANDFMIEIIP